MQELLVMRNKLTDQNDGIEHEIMVGYIITAKCSCFHINIYKKVREILKQRKDFFCNDRLIQF